MLFNHSVTEININNSIAVSVFMRDSSEGKNTPVEVAGSRIVLATGGIQNARLLKLSLPGENRYVGSYFCEHPHIGDIASIILDKEVFDQVIDKQATRVAHAISLSSDFSNVQSLISATFEVKGSDRFAKNLLGQSRITITGGSDHSRRNVFN